MHTIKARPTLTGEIVHLLRAGSRWDGGSYLRICLLRSLSPALCAHCGVNDASKEGPSQRVGGRVATH